MDVGSKLGRSVNASPARYVQYYATILYTLQGVAMWNGVLSSELYIVYTRIIKVNKMWSFAKCDKS